MASGFAFLAATLLGLAVPGEAPAASDQSDRVAETFEAVQHQIRVERRVIVRITPFGARQVPSKMSAPDARPVTRSVDASGPVKDGCVPLSEVAGVRLADGRRLLLFMRDRTVISASFERSCPVQGFYSGFYVERPRDGLLCAGRERLHARSGTDCTLGGFSEPRDNAEDED